MKNELILPFALAHNAIASKIIPGLLSLFHRLSSLLSTFKYSK